MDTRKLLLAYALENSTKYNGKVNLGSVIGKIYSDEELKKNPKHYIEEAKKIVNEVNSMNLEQQLKLYEELKSLIEKPKEEYNLFDFLGIKQGEKIITAFPPEPSKYPHIGHAKSIIINYELAKQSHGKFILRFDDSNPKQAKKEFYNVHLENYKWLGIKFDKIDYASKHMNEFYKHAELLIKKNHAYVCLCKQEIIKKNRFKGIPCAHRNYSVSENLKLWKKMNKMKEGSAVLRIKIDLKHKNTTMRDPAIIRIIKAKHPLLSSKYKLWPTYDFETAIMDGLQGITHRIRSKEFELRSELQHYLQKLLGFKETRTYEYARFNLEGTESSGRIIREKIRKKQLIGWDDPSLTTIVALRRRGFLAKSIYEFVLSTGISKAESTLTWDSLITFNRKIIDSIANRYFFIENPVKIKIKNSPKLDIELNLHPDYDRGKRKFKTKEEFYISKKDYKELKNNNLYRLMDCLNFIKKGNKFIYDSREYEIYKEKGYKIMHWLPVQKDLVKIEVFMPNHEIKKGLGEPLIKKLKLNDVIQFERFGFCKLDKKNSGKLVFWYTHN